MLVIWPTNEASNHRSKISKPPLKDIVTYFERDRGRGLPVSENGVPVFIYVFFGL